MAKRFTVPQVKSTAHDVQEISTVTSVAISAKTQRLIDALKADFSNFTSDFRAIVSSRAVLAPKLMKAFGAWQTETGGTFVMFIRVIDPSVPEKREEYRAHTSYQAADYLRRLIGRQQTEQQPVNLAEVPATPLEALAHLVAAVLPLVSDADILWKAFAEQLHWSENQIHRVQLLAAQSAPMLSAPKTAKPLLRAA